MLNRPWYRSRWFLYPVFILTVLSIVSLGDERRRDQARATGEEDQTPAVTAVEDQQPQPNAYQQACDDVHGIASADLCAQVRMAEASQRQAVLLLLEVLLLSATFGVALVAVRFARQAADANRQQARAWISIIEIKAWGDYVLVKIANRGETPATYCRAFFGDRFFREANRDLDQFWATYTPFSSWAVLGGGDTREFLFPVDPEKVAAVKERRGSLYLFLSFEYSTVFKTRGVTTEVVKCVWGDRGTPDYVPYGYDAKAT